MSDDHAPDEAFLSRWARRKQQRPVQPPAAAPTGKAGAPRSTGVPGAYPSGAPPGDVETPFDVSTLPKVEELTAESDIAAFLTKGVPEELKRLALRRAWSLDPAIRDFIEVAENQYNWNVPGGVPGFGELDAGTSIEALLAQAIGERKPAPPEELAVAPVADAPREMAAVSPAPQPKIAGIERGEPLAAPPPDAASATGAQPPSTEIIHVNPTASPPRRRHGGALPV